MSHACRGIGAFAHAINFGFGSVLNSTKSVTAAALLLVSAVAPDVAFAQSGPTKTEVPLIDTYKNPCTGEVVTITGTTDLFLYTKLKKTGGIDVTTRISHQGTGTSVVDGSTVTYTFHSDETAKLTDVPSGGFETAMMTKTMLVRHGGSGISENDWMFKNTVRIRIDEFGNITMIEREKISDVCTAE